MGLPTDERPRDTPLAAIRLARPRINSQTSLACLCGKADPQAQTPQHEVAVTDGAETSREQGTEAV